MTWARLVVIVVRESAVFAALLPAQVLYAATQGFDLALQSFDLVFKRSKYSSSLRLRLTRPCGTRPRTERSNQAALLSAIIRCT
jgi:hypothetical protein